MARLNIEQFQQLMANIPKAVAAEMRSAVAAAGQNMANSMRQNVHTGIDGRNELLESIVSGQGRHELQARITAGGILTTRSVREGASATYDYAMANEYGTQKMPAQPFFWPTYRMMKKRTRSEIARAMRKGIEKVVKLK